MAIRQVLSPELTIDRFLRPSPQRVSRTVLDRLEERNHKNNIIALETQRKMHEVMTDPDYYQMKRWNRLQLQQIRGMTFDGFYPMKQDFDALRDSMRGKNGRVRELVRQVSGSLQEMISTEERRWRGAGLSPTELHSVQNTIAVRNFIRDNGGRFAVFGSARTRPGSPEYEGTKWLSHMLVEHLPKEDGSTEQVISGAGPGIMEAANEGAMHGAWDHLQTMVQECKDSPADSALESRITHFRKQMHSIGVRIELAFESGWNDHLYGNLSIDEFPGRKKALIMTAGGSNPDAKDPTKEYDWHGRHPAIFVASGGIGTRDELWEAVCLVQCKKMPAMPIITIGEAEKVMASRLFDVMEEQGTISPGDRELILTASDEVDAIQKYLDWHNIVPSPALRKAMADRRPSMDATDEEPSILKHPGSATA